MDKSLIDKELCKQEYNFLRDNENLGDNIIILTFGGSHAYGTNIADSDIDIRGIALNSSSDILLGNDFGQVIESCTDTVIYSFNKVIKLLTENNPNTLEILGCKPEHYFRLTTIGKELIDNRHMFLSKLCINTFGEYASSQLRRLENKTVRDVEQSRKEAHILRSIENARFSFKDKYLNCNKDDIKLYLSDSSREELDKEIFMDINLFHYPLRDWANMWNEMKSIVSSYEKIGKRNKKAIEHDKLGKHMEHLVRLYFMCLDILEKNEIITYRECEHDLLMKIRLGEYLNSDDKPTSDFYELVNELDKRLDYAKNNTSLRELPDIKRINEFKFYVNKEVILRERQ